MSVLGAEVVSERALRSLGALNVYERGLTRQSWLHADSPYKESGLTYRLSRPENNAFWQMHRWHPGASSHTGLGAFKAH